MEASRFIMPLDGLHCTADDRPPPTSKRKTVADKTGTVCFMSVDH